MMPPVLLRPLGFGEILDGAFTLYRRNFVTFAVTTLIPTVAVAAAFRALGGGFVRAMRGADPLQIVSEFLTAMLLVMALAAVLVVTLWPALTRQATQAYTGQPTSVADGFRASARALPRMLGAAFLAWVVSLVAGIPVGLLLGIVTSVFAAMGPGGAAVGGVLFLVGNVAYSLAAMAVLFAVVPAIVVEGAGPLQAIERSFTLARGALGRVVGVMMVSFVITYLPMAAVMALTGQLAQMIDPQAVPTPAQALAQLLLGMGVGILTTPFLASVIVLLYFDRRVRTEALDVQMMADRLAVAGH